MRTIINFKLTGETPVHFKKSSSCFRIILVLVFYAANTFGQIPNSGFENWTNAGSHLNPDGWWTPNDSVATGSFYPVARSTDHYPTNIGSYSMRLENNISLLPDWAGYGITWTGDFSGNNYPVFPIVDHPTSMWGYYKFLPQNNDTMEIHIRLYKNGVDISGGYFKNYAPAATWASFNITFNTYLDADSARIMMSTCYDNDAPIPYGNSVLYIDNLSFDSLIVADISDIERENTISIYPNPVKKLLIISYPLLRNNEVTITVSNITGKIIYTTTTLNSEKFEVKVSDFSDGMYMVQVSTNDFIETKKVVVIR